MNNKHHLIGNTFTNNKGESFIVNKFLYSKGTEYYYEIQFLNTGSIKIAEQRNIKHGRVRDDYSRHICGVACKGKANSQHPLFNKIAFKRWYSMIERCHNPHAHMYPSYGGKGVTVSDRWLCFENYLADIVNLDGFDYEKYIDGEIQLDKDIKIIGNTLYDKDTCIFVDKSTNAKYQPKKMKQFIATDINGEQYIFESQNECARQFNLTARTIGKVLNKELKSHKGWTFRYIDKGDE